MFVPSHAPGGLLCRGFLEAYPDHNVRTFISLSSPQAGQFGGERLGPVFELYSYMHGLSSDTEFLNPILPKCTRDLVYL